MCLVLTISFVFIGNWRDTKTEDNSIAWDDKKGQQQQQQQQQESQEQQNKKTSSPRSENDNNLLAAFAASALKTSKRHVPEAKRMQRNAKIAALKAEVIKKALNLDSGRMETSRMNSSKTLK